MKKLAVCLGCVAAVILGHAQAQDPMKAEAMAQATGMAKAAMKPGMEPGADMAHEAMRPNTVQPQHAAKVQAQEASVDNPAKGEKKHKGRHKTHGKKMDKAAMAQ